MGSIRQPRLPILRTLHKSGSGITRRDFLKGSAILGAAALFPPLRWASAATQPRVVIIGAGIAGLNAAYQLKKAGISSTVYEASMRSGGRMLSVKDVMGTGLITELGGEFVDGGHLDMITLANEFELGFIDRQDKPNKDLKHRAYYFGGKFYTDKDIIETYEPFRKQMAIDALILNREVTFDHPAQAEKLDNTPLSTYLKNLAMPKWLEDLLTNAYTTEFGMDTSEQSALNLLSLFPSAMGDKFELYGESDERYKVLGGNQQITNELEKRVYMSIEFGHKLTSIKQKGGTYTLNFAKKGSAAKKVEADILLIALPFSILRKIPFEAELPDWKRKAIKELGYGSATKVMIGYSKRIWRDLGYTGEVVSDEPFQLAWDNSELQQGDAGGITAYTGGKHAKESAKGTIKKHADEFAKALDKVYPGSIDVRSPKIARMDWSGNSFSLGCYSAYKAGQWTTIRGAEGKPVDNIFFAGEHCSMEFQGFMNGGAETGKLAAEAIQLKIKN
jgi:monoamine oxidase